MKKNYPAFRFWILFLIIFKLFAIEAVHAQYCVPSNIGGWNTNYISRVRLGNIDNRTSVTIDRYNYYSSVVTPNIKVGETIKATISVTINGWNIKENTIVVWIDFNANNIFEENERFLYKITDSNNVSDNKTINVPISIPIPSTAKLGSSRIRIGFREGVDYNNFTSCNYNNKAGEVEDYKINLTTGPSSLPDPLTGDYEASYCVPNQINNYGIYYISNVKIGSIDNSSSGNTGSYTNFSNTISTDVIMGETITGSVSVTMNGNNVDTNQIIVWMNFNENDHDNFDESTERFVFDVKDNRNMNYNTPKTISVPISISIPSTAEVGISRMRVAFKGGNGNNYSACYFGSNVGEIEDYKIKILPSIPEEEEDYFETLPPATASLYFNGIDNYVSGESFINGLRDVTMMAWVKSDSGNSKDMVVLGEDLGCQIALKNGNVPVFTISTSQGVVSVAANCSNCSINLDEWHHITGSYSSATGLVSLYIDGKLVNSSNVGAKNLPIMLNQNANHTFEIGRFSNKLKNDQYFKGNIDEVRIFKASLTESQIQQMVYQEIDNNGELLKGKIVPKNIKDITTGNKVSWNDLVAYYPMTDIKDRTILDFSSNAHNIKLFNLKTVQEQTAPMPYVTIKDGDWSHVVTWEHGSVWDIKDIKDWSIIRISSNVDIENSLQNYGLIIDFGKTLTISGDNLVRNSGYLELNGTLDLLNESQLIQTVHSDLVTSSNGKILRRQEGAVNPFWYNYWASPVGAPSVSTLSDNNGAENNTNNSPFRLELIKDGNGVNMPFVSGHTANKSISSYWLNTFKNAVTYLDWARFNKSTPIAPGVGYTQKGSGLTGTDEQQYIFEGKPNNGTILIDVKDKGGEGSVPGVSATSYLVGNPYPSALDINKFIDDNRGVISGTLQLWQQWSGNSHNLKDYNGGYAQVNKLGGVRAYQFMGRDGSATGKQDGTLTPSRYIAVAQGFMVEIIADGKLKFNNSQRAFVKESSTNKSVNPGSVFFKGASNKAGGKDNSVEKQDEIKKIRLEFNSVTGPTAKRELILGFSDFTSDDFDYGYDAVSNELNNNDLHLSLNGIDMNMQAYSQLRTDKVVPLNFKSSGSNSFELKITELENIEDSQEIYLKDNFLGTYFNLKDNKPYFFTSEQGKFNERFEIVFQSQEKSLSVEDRSVLENFVYYKNSERKLFATKLDGSITKLAIVNMLGQTTAEFNNISQEELKNGLNMPTMANGAYVAYFRSNNNQVFTKKIIIN